MLIADTTGTSNSRLDSWKEIAAFFGRDERTVKRWEKDRSLPVHRFPGAGRSRVFAYERELSEWLRAGTSSPPVPTAASDPSRRKRIIAWVTASLLGLTALGFVVANPHVHSTGRPAHVPNPEAEDLYLKGRYCWNKRSPENLTKAVDYFTQAVVKDPAYAQPYVGLADCYNLLREFSTMAPAEAYPRALAAARKAVELDDTSAAAHSALAFVSVYWLWDLRAGEREFKRAIELNPKYVPAHHWYATFLITVLRTREGLAEIERARELDPASTPIVADKALILFLAGRQDEAIASLKQLESTEPAFLSTHQYLANIYLQRGQYRDYLAESKRAAVLLHDAPVLSITTAAEQGFAARGARGMLEAVRRAQAELLREGLVQAYDLAETCSLLGDRREALRYLGEAYDHRDVSVVGMRFDWRLNNLHGEPAYRNLLQRIGLPPVQ